MTDFNIKDILNTLPHRYPFLLVDKVLQVTPGESITAIKNVSINEPFFQGHFPQGPVMPGVLMIEALAQAAGLLIFKTNNKAAGPDNWFYLAGVDNARFKRIVEPGDQLQLDVKIINQKRTIWKFECKATVDGELAVSADIINAGGSLA